MQPGNDPTASEPDEPLPTNREDDVPTPNKHLQERPTLMLGWIFLHIGATAFGGLADLYQTAA